MQKLQMCFWFFLLQISTNIATGQNYDVEDMLLSQIGNDVSMALLAYEQENKAILFQQGQKNHIYLNQLNKGQLTLASQLGIKNIINAINAGNFNTLEVIQSGEENILRTHISGNNNFSAINQKGNNNILEQRVYGNNRNYEILQVGNFNQLTYFDKGGSPYDYKITQRGNGMKVIIRHNP